VVSARRLCAKCRDSGAQPAGLSAFAEKPEGAAPAPEQAAEVDGYAVACRTVRLLERALDWLEEAASDPRIPKTDISKELRSVAGRIPPLVKEIRAYEQMHQEAGDAATHEQRRDVFERWFMDLPVEQARDLFESLGRALRRVRS
jgi:hypothetical protein